MKDPRINRESAKLILDWCYLKLGKSRFHKELPKLIVHNKTTEETKKYWGYYSDDNTINLYLPNICDIHRLINTVIHEFWHYKQSPEMYHKYAKIFDVNHFDTYETHPHEIAARNKARKLQQQCYEELFKTN